MMLDNSETSADFLYQQLPNGFISFGAEGNIIKVNQTMCSWLGATQAEILDKPFMSLLGKGSLLYYNLIVIPMLTATSQVHEVNLKFRTHQGDIDTLFNAVSYFNANGEKLVVNCTVQKITGRKKYELILIADKRKAEEEKRRFEFLYHLVPTQLWTASPDGKFLSVNQKFSDYFGNYDLESLSAFEHVIDEDREKLIMLWSNSIGTGVMFESEVRVKGADGSYEWFVMCAEPYYNEGGEIETWYGSSTNVHKHKIVHLLQISSLTDHLKVAEQTLNDNEVLFMNIASDQSHMVRKPLANIIGLVELLKYQDLDQDSLDMIRMITESTTELDQMIRKSAGSRKRS